MSVYSGARAFLFCSANEIWHIIHVQCGLCVARVSMRSKYSCLCVCVWLNKQEHTIQIQNKKNTRINEMKMLNKFFSSYVGGYLCTYRIVKKSFFLRFFSLHFFPFSLSRIKPFQTPTSLFSSIVCGLYYTHIKTAY